MSGRELDFIWHFSNSLVLGQELISAFKVSNKFLISAFIFCSTFSFPFNSANKFKIELIHGFVTLNTLEVFA